MEDQAKCQVLEWSHLQDHRPTQQPIYQVVIQSQTYHNSSSSSNINNSNNNSSNSSNNNKNNKQQP